MPSIRSQVQSDITNKIARHVVIFKWKHRKILSHNQTLKWKDTHVLILEHMYKMQATKRIILLTEYAWTL
jgi:hypothetical protein